MTKLIRREMRRRGFSGRIFLPDFLAFNALMIAWLLVCAALLGDMQTSSEAERLGVGGMLGTGAIIFAWTAGAAITGLFAGLMRRSKHLHRDDARRGASLQQGSAVTSAR
jgi:hypothetical protein